MVEGWEGAMASWMRPTFATAGELGPGSCTQVNPPSLEW